MDEKTILKKLVEHQYELNSKNHTVLQEIAGISRSLLDVSKEMSETNKCVAKTLELNTAAVHSIEKFWGRIVMFLVGVLAVLAGVRSVGELLGGIQ